MAEQNNKKERKLTLPDAFISIFYLIIIAVGVHLCISRGQNASPAHLCAVTISVIAVLALKIAKYKNELKAHLGELVFIGILAILGLFAIVTTVIL